MIRTARPDRMATTGPLSEPAIPVSPQTAGPAVPEREIAPGGVSGCSAMPGSEKVQPARQSWRIQGGAGHRRTPRRPRCRHGEDRPMGAGRPTLRRPQGSDPTAGFGNGNVKPPEILDGVGGDHLLVGAQHVGGAAAPPSGFGRVGEVEHGRIRAPVGQGQLRGEVGVVLPHRVQHHRDELGHGVRRAGCRIKTGGKDEG